MPHRARLFVSTMLILAGVGVALLAVPDREAKPYDPPIAGATDEAERAIAGFAVPDGFKVELFAAEPDVANPVAFHIDERGRVFVAETFRQGDAGGVVDNRNHMYWLDDDLAAQSVEDRRAFFTKHNKEDIERWSTHHDRLRLLEDADGDGKADKAIVFADGYNDLVDGTGAGVLARNGDVYYTCIPKLYLLRDTDGDGKADEQKVLSDGYGVKVALRGHDLHGLVIGPDGRLYFSIGDRGYNVVTKEGKTLKDVNSGAVFRCELDGSNLEVVYTGLRNPQELVFDEHGNLFTGDNNSDAGDQARWTWIVEGGNTGWRMSYQYLPDRGPWNREGWWHEWTPEHAAFITPPIAHISSGPSGVTYYPGTGMPSEYNGRFFLCDFRGGASNSGIHMFRMKPRGAWFELVDREKFVWNTLVTDADFGYDGAMYFTDWVHGWEGLGRGRVYRVFHEKAAKQPIVNEVATLFREGFAQRKPAELARLLRHIDKRVRQEAQFALVGQQAYGELISAIKLADDKLAALHGIWGCAQAARFEKDEAQRDKLWAAVELALNAGDAEMRAQACKVIGERRGDAEATVNALLKRLNDESPRVRLFAAMSLGKLAGPDTKAFAVAGLLQLLRDNADADPFLRHAAVMGLAHIGDADALVQRMTDKSRAARMGILLALRRLRDPRISGYLNDEDKALAVEAARAINDLPIDEALPQLAAMIDRKTIINDDALLRRSINANYRLGGQRQAHVLAQFAQRDDMPVARRIEALEVLATWDGESPRERVLGVYRPVPPREADEAQAAANSAINAVLTGDAPAAVKQAAIQLVTRYKLANQLPLLLQVVKDAKQPASLRTVALRTLGDLKYERVKEAVTAALADEDITLRGEARDLLARLNPDEAVPVLDKVLATGETSEKQAALATLARMKSPAADAVLLKWLDALIKGDVPAAIQLDLLEAAASRNTNRMKLKLAAYDAGMPENDPVTANRHLLVGGDRERGRKVFWENQRAACQRCHQVGSQGAGEAGPNLAGIGAKQERKTLLESILLPNAKITEGFETIDIATLDGDRIIGVVREQTDHAITLVTPDNQRVTIKKADIDRQRATKSAMPEDASKHLSPRELRDLVEYLAQLK